MATSTIKNQKIAFSKYESITAPFTAPSTGFIRVGLNPKTTAGGIVRFTIYETASQFCTYVLNVTNGETTYMVVPVGNGFYLSSVATSTDAGTVYLSFMHSSIS